ncbi:hypothetical protein SO802_017760 [Lithocarpus litseifolius]|uniref:MULE transposase domain-containing protein n=1 Tax=Lithocarpus litseifolius TaxID=425828 RepID=A0AAW2CJ59_9ROSI
MVVGWKSHTHLRLTCILPLLMPRLFPTTLNHASAVDDLDNTEKAEILSATQTHDLRGSSHAYEHVQAYMDEGIDIEASRDVYEESIDTNGPMNDAKVVTDGRMMDSRVISIALKQYVQEDITRFIKDLRSMLHAKHGHDITMYKVWEAKQKAVACIYGNFDESYMELPQFLAALDDVDRDTVTLLKCNPRVPGNCIFNSVFWAFDPCIKGFKHCKPVISIDAIHLYGKYKGNLLIAMATDGNNEVYPLTFVIVESESMETWGWYLACLLIRVTDRTNLCIISDKHRGIQSCFNDTIKGYLQAPLTHHRYCLRHLVSNVNTNFNRVALKNLVWKAATVNQVRKFENTMNCIKNANPDAYDYLKDVA